jgi:hypothetical protein
MIVVFGGSWCLLARRNAREVHLFIYIIVDSFNLCRSKVESSILFARGTRPSCAGCDDGCSAARMRDTRLSKVV